MWRLRSRISTHAWQPAGSKKSECAADTASLIMRKKAQHETLAARAPFTSSSERRKEIKSSQMQRERERMARGVVKKYTLDYLKQSIST
jgi:hypothetical protein